MSDAAASRRRLLVTAILAASVAVRLGYYAARPSLTIDETTLSLDLGLRSLGELTHPLVSLQTGPLLFLWGEKLSIAVLGMNEFALRLIPLVGGLLVPLFVWKVGCRLLPGPAALLALALAAASPALIQYTVTAKPYITDALVGLIVLHSTLDLLEHADAVAVWLRFGLVGVVSILASLPAPFILTGSVATCVLGGSTPTRRTTWRLLACVAAWGAVWAVLYARLYGPVAGSWYMQQFWGPASFAPLHGAGWWNLARGVVMSLIARPAPAGLVITSAGLLGLGLWAWLSRLPRAHAALVGTIFVVLFLASALNHYPLAARLLIFVVPLLVMSLAALVSRVAASAPRLAWALGAITLLGLVGVDVAHPYRPPAMRLAVDSLGRLLDRGEPVYLASGSIPAWALYTTDWRAPDTAYLDWIARVAGTPGAPAFHNSPPRAHPVSTDEGADLQTRRGGRVELLALASGIQWQEGRGFGVTVAADSGWAAREAIRIRQVAAPTIWLMQANSYPTTVPGLAAALAQAGGTVDTSLGIGGVRIARYRFSISRSAERAN